MEAVSYVVFQNITQQYKGNKEVVLNDFNLTIEQGEFVVVVGPSGSGKSTLLELICGFIEPSCGSIAIDGQVMNGMAPKDRNIAMVFQNYALFPHLTTYENIAFGMKIRKVKKLEIDYKVRWAAKMLGIEPYLDALPKKLSGGQRQRVALARAIVREPKLFLMDEPLSNLDAKLRDATCNELTSLHKKIGGTMIYVTHDQVEALTMADRMVVLDQGVIQQVGTPQEIYTNPHNLFVASFIGRPQMNLFPCVFDGIQFVTKEGMAFKAFVNSKQLIIGEAYIVGVRAEHIKMVEAIEETNTFTTWIEKTTYLGSEQILHLKYKDISFTVKTDGSQAYVEGDWINIGFDLSKVIIFDKKTGLNVEETNR